MSIKWGRVGTRVLVDVSWEPKPVYGVVVELAPSTRGGLTLATILLDGGQRYVTDGASDRVRPTWSTEEQAQRERLAIARALAELDRGLNGSTLWLRACASNARRELSEAVTPPALADDIVHVAPFDRTLDHASWRALMNAHHVECVCDVTKVARHCKSCGFSAPWPCHIRSLLDDAETA